MSHPTSKMKPKTELSLEKRESIGREQILVENAKILKIIQDRDFIKLKSIIEEHKSRLKKLQLIKGYPTSVLHTMATVFIQGLKYATKIGDLEILKLLLSNKQLLISVDIRDSVGKTTLLMIAVYNGQVAVVEFLLEQGADPNQKLSDGWTALHYAIQSITLKEATDQLSGEELVKCKTIVHALLKKKADPNVVDKEKDCTPLQLATRHGDLELVQLLVKFGAKASHELQDPSENAVFYAVRLKKYDIFKYLITRPGFDLETLYEDRTLLTKVVMLKDEVATQILIDNGARANDSPLYIAVSGGHVGILKILLTSRTIKVDTLYENNATALMIACRHNQMACVEFLLNAKANVNLQNFCGATALQAAVRGNHWAVVKRLLQENPDVNAVVKQPLEGSEECYSLVSAITMAVENENEAIVQLLLDANARVQDFIDHTSDGIVATTVIDVAVSVKSITLLKLLLNSKQFRELEQTQKEKIQYSAFAYAMARNFTQAFELLADGLNLNLIEKDTHLLIMACALKNTEAVRFLIARGVDVNVQLNGGTPLINAAQVGSADIVSLLIAAGAKPDEKDKEGNTALMYASANGHKSCVERLLNAKADIDLQCDEGYTVFMVAALYGQTQIIELLQSKREINFKTCNKNGFNALALAKNPETVKVLYSLGATGAPTRVQTKLKKLLTRFSDIERIREALEVVDVRMGYKIPGIEFKIIVDEETALSPENYPLFLYANDSSFEIKALVLKHKLYKDFPKIPREKINSAIEQLVKICDDFSFAEDGSVCIVITVKKRGYKAKHHITLAQHGMTVLLDHDTTLSEHDFMELLLESSEEGVALKKENDIKGLKRRIFDQLQNAFMMNDKYQTLLNALEKTAKESSRNQTHTADLILLRSKCQAHLETIKALRQDIRTAEVMQSDNKKTILEYIAKIELLVSKQETTIAEPLRNIKNAIDIEAARTSDSKKMTPAESHQKKKTKALKKKKAQERKKLLETFQQTQIKTETVKEQPKTGALQAKSQKVVTLEKKQTIDAVAKSEGKEDADKAGAVTANMSITTQTLGMSEETLRQIELEREAVLQRTTVVPLKTPKILKTDEISDQAFAAAVSMRTSNLITHNPIKIPGLTLDRAGAVSGSLTSFIGHKQAEQGRATLDLTMSGLAAISKAHPEKNKAEEQVSSLQLLIESNSIKGALAQSLEMRKPLEECWPNHIRNVIFRSEESIDKLVTEQQFVSLVQSIHINLSKIPESELRQSPEKLKISDIDAPLPTQVKATSSLRAPQGTVGFLEELSKVKIATFSLDRAEMMIMKSLKELKQFQEYIQEHRENVAYNQNLFMAIGFSLQRIGTHFGDIRENKAKLNIPISKSQFYRYISFGNSYRHHDDSWMIAVENFIQDCLKMPVREKDQPSDLKEKAQVSPEKAFRIQMSDPAVGASGGANEPLLHAYSSGIGGRGPAPAAAPHKPEVKRSEARFI